MVLDFPILADYVVLLVAGGSFTLPTVMCNNLKNLPPLAPGMSCCMATPTFRRGQSSAKAIST